MPMDEVIHAIERAGTEDMQDILDVVVKRYRMLYPNYSFAIISLPKYDKEEQIKQLESVLQMITENND